MIEPSSSFSQQTSRAESLEQPEAVSPMTTVPAAAEDSTGLTASGPIEGDPQGFDVKGRPGYLDLLYLALFAVPSFILSMLICVVVFFGLNYSAGWDLSVEDVRAKATLAVAAQLLWWALVLAFIYSLITVKYQLPFGPAIGWRPLKRSPLLWCMAGVFLAVSVAIIAQVIPMPEESLPIEELLRDRSSLILLAVFGIGVAPVTEELVFRGFAFGVFERAHGQLAAILLTSAIFSFIHGSQYGWHWQNLVLLFYVGVVFGSVRAKTQSVVPATIIHAAYNTTLLMGLLSAGGNLEPV